MKGMFLRTSSVEAAYIYVACMWSWSWEHDKSLNKGQQDLTKLNTKQVAFVEGLNHERAYMALVGIYHHWGTLRFSIILRNKSPIVIHVWNNIIAALVSLFHVSQQPRLGYNTCNPQSFRFMMVTYKPSNPYLEKYQAVN